MTLNTQKQKETIAAEMHTYSIYVKFWNNPKEEITVFDVHYKCTLKIITWGTKLILLSFFLSHMIHC